MRMSKAQPFMDVPADYSPEGWEGSSPPPTFSEAFLYATLGKDEARFVLGVAEEYEHVIEALGPAAVKAILDVRPRLVQRLGVGQLVQDSLADARSEIQLSDEERAPSQALLDREAAVAVWSGLHDDYRRFYNPEEDMRRDALRAYNALTDALGREFQRQRQAERDRLPEKLARRAEAQEQVRRRQDARAARREIILKCLGNSVAGETPEDVAGNIERSLRYAGALPEDG